MYQAFIDFTTSPFFGVFSALIGFIFGHRFAINRDKRKEWNEIIEPINITLTKERFRPAICAYFLPEDNILIARQMMPFWKRRSFDKTIQKYYIIKDSSETIPSDSNPTCLVYKKPEEITDAVDRLLPYFARK